MEDKMMPLGLLGTGEKAEVMEIRERNRGVKPAAACCGPDGNGWSCRMENMGLRTGKVVEMLNNEGAGAMLIKVDESRIAIGRGMAMKIMVRRQG